MAIIDGNNSNNLLNGTADADVISGKRGVDTLNGLAGDDTLNGGAGRDLLYGGADDDLLDGGTGRDSIYGDDGNDTIIADNFNNEIADGGAGSDWLDFSASRRSLTIDISAADYATNGASAGVSFGRSVSVFAIENFIGGQYDDTIIGNADDNHFIGGDGADSLSGGAGDDILAPGTGGDADVLDGGDGNDTVDYSDATGGIVLALKNAAINAGEAASDVLTNIESVIATDFADKLGGDANANHFTLGAGDDTSYAFEGNDTLLGGDGADRLYGMDGDDSIVGGAQDDNLFGGAGADVLDGGAGSDWARYDDANYGALVIDLSNAANNTGAAAGDSYISIENIRAGIGDDTITGDAQANEIFAHSGYDTVYGGDGNDTIDGYAAADGLFGQGGDDVLLGGAGDDTLDGGAGSNTLTGGKNEDTFVFGNHGDNADTITDFVSGFDDIDISGWGFASGAGFEAAVTVNTLASGIEIVFAPGQSLTIATAGYTLDVTDFGFTAAPTGNTLSALLVRDSGAKDLDVDMMQAGLEIDVTGQINLWIGNDVFAGSSGNDSVFAHAGHDSISGAGGDDSLMGYAGSDTLRGGVGNDTLLGGGGNDVLNGDGDNDVLDGGKGRNTLTGGKGADTFVYADLGNNCDTITDFNAAEGDRIDLSGFGFADGAAFTAAVEQIDVASGLMIRFQMGQTLTIEDTGYTLDTADFIF